MQDENPNLVAVGVLVADMAIAGPPKRLRLPQGQREGTTGRKRTGGITVDPSDGDLFHLRSKRTVKAFLLESYDPIDVVETSAAKCSVGVGPRWHVAAPLHSRWRRIRREQETGVT